MNPKLLLGLALVLSGVLAGCSQNNDLAVSEADRLENNREIVRLATLINPTNPPVTDEMLQTGEFNGQLFELNANHDSAYFKGVATDNAKALLLRLTRYSYPPKMRKQFGSFGVYESDFVHESAARVLTSMAVPAVVPILQGWLTNNLTAAEKGNPCQWGKLDEAIKDLTRFRETNMVPLLVVAWQKEIFEKKIDPLALGGILDMRYLRQTVIQTLAEMPTPGAQRILNNAMNDKRLDEFVRYPVAAALVRLGDQAGRDKLLEGLDKYLAPDQDTLESSRHNPAFYELEKLGDTKLISAIEAKAAAATRKRLQLVLPRLVEQMRINNLPPEELRQIAASDKSLNRRLPAIMVLGDTGKADELLFLESLLPATEEYHGLQGQRDNLVRVLKAAIRNVRLHNWQQFSK
jgi:hypothetical protein